jgi:hypothetical protein
MTPRIEGESLRTNRMPYSIWLTDDGLSHGYLVFVIRERAMAGVAAARARDKVGGRPPIMTAEKLAIDRQMLDDGVAKTTVAKTVGFIWPTLYAHLGAE